MLTQVEATDIPTQPTFKKSDRWHMNAAHSPKLEWRVPYPMTESLKNNRLISK